MDQTETLASYAPLEWFRPHGSKVGHSSAKRYDKRSTYPNSEEV